MTKEEFKLNIVFDKMGLCPTEECFEGMWEMWKYLHSPIDEDKLYKLSREYAIKRIDEYRRGGCDDGIRLSIVSDEADDGFEAGYRKAKEE